MIKDPHCDSQGPNVCRLAGVPILTRKLMFGAPETWGPRGEIRDIVFSFEPDCGKVDDYNFIAHAFGFAAEDVIDLNISISDAMVMQVFDSLAGL